MENLSSFENTVLIAPVMAIEEPCIADAGIEMFVKRDDLIHPEISGNKWRKLKYNLLEAQTTKLFCSPDLWRRLFQSHPRQRSGRKSLWFQNHRDHSRRAARLAQSDASVCPGLWHGVALCQPDGLPRQKRHFKETGFAG
jgi:hypothetical protein